MADINSLDDILNSDTFGILDKEDEEDIFTLKNVPETEKPKFKSEVQFLKN